MEKLPRHLGGHLNITHIDEGALLFLKNKFDIKTMIDVGCGPGGMLDLAEKHGIFSIGIDGDYTIFKKRVIAHDFIKGPFEFGLFDLGWSVEFLEHVEEKYIDNFMPIFKKCRIVAVTHALPNKRGHHHVNCQPPEYWIDVFKRYGLIYDKEESEILRSKSTMRREFMRTTGMVFQNLERNTHNCYFPVEGNPQLCP